MLNVGSGDFSLIADSVLEFTELAMTPERREEWFAEREAKFPVRGSVLAFTLPSPSSLLLPVAISSYPLFGLPLPSSVKFTLNTPQIMTDLEVGWAQKWAQLG